MASDVFSAGITQTTSVGFTAMVHGGTVSGGITQNQSGANTATISLVWTPDGIFQVAVVGAGGVAIGKGVTPQVTITQTLGGDFLAAATVTAGVVQVQTLGGRLRWDAVESYGVTQVQTLGYTAFGVAEVFAAGITQTHTLGGTFVAGKSVIPSIYLKHRVVGRFAVDPRFVSTPEGRYRKDGRRPALPLIVYAINIRSEFDATTPQAEIPNNGHFLVSPEFNRWHDPSFFAAGAAKNYIGTYVVPETNPPYYSFREPFEGEVVWYVNVTLDAKNLINAGTALYTEGQVTDRRLMRYANGAWSPYRSQAERSIEGDIANDVLDPDQINTYYARLVGAVQGQLAIDSQQVRSMLDTRSVPGRFLEYLADNLGFRFRDTSDPATQRRRLQAAVLNYKQKGMEALIQITLRELGYQGYSLEIWVDPVATDNWRDVADAPAAVQGDIADRGLTSLINPDNGEKGQDLIVKPHGWTSLDPEDVGYYPSSRLAIVLRRRNGDPLPVNQSPEALAAIASQISRELREDVLPAHVDVRFFVRDDDVSTPETAEVSDAFVTFETEILDGGITQVQSLGGGFVWDAVESYGITQSIAVGGSFVDTT